MKFTASVSSLLFLLAIAVSEVAAGTEQQNPSVSQTPGKPKGAMGCPPGYVFINPGFPSHLTI
jgi:hypothetical protein